MWEVSSLWILQNIVMGVNSIVQLAYMFNLSLQILKSEIVIAFLNM